MTMMISSQAKGPFLSVTAVKRGFSESSATSTRHRSIIVLFVLSVLLSTSVGRAVLRGKFVAVFHIVLYTTCCNVYNNALFGDLLRVRPQRETQTDNVYHLSGYHLVSGFRGAGVSRCASLPCMPWKTANGSPLQTQFPGVSILHIMCVGQHFSLAKIMDWGSPMPCVWIMLAVASYFHSSGWQLS